MEEKYKINFSLILEGCKASNPSSQERLYRHFYGYGMNVALRYAKSKSEAEEILNDAFLKVFKNIHQFQTDLPFKSWFRKVVVNTAVDSFRRHKKYNDMFSSMNPDLEAFSNEVFELNFDESIDVLPIIQELPPAYKMVFNLYVMEGYKHQEIAKMLNISVGTSKSNLSRAKEKLKASLLKKKISDSKTLGHG